jgi:hypothetical protein
MYPLTLDLINFLFTDRAHRELLAFSEEDLLPENTLSVVSRLRKSYTPEQTAVLLDQAVLRRRARKKFPQSARMFFTEEALQQATGPEIADYHASLFSDLNLDRPLADLGCGIGGDTLAFAKRQFVIAVEQDAIRYRLAKVNVGVCGLSDKVEMKCADWTTLALPVKAGYIDPSRRITVSPGESKRVFHLSEMQPPLPVILGLQQKIINLAVKVAPGLNHDEIPSNAEVSFISVKGQMKEGLLRFGQLRTGAFCTAVLLPGKHIIDDRSPVSCTCCSQPMTYLYEPDPAVIRAGLVQNLAAMLGAVQMDTQIAYLTCDRLIKSPFVSGWRVYRNGPFLLKKLKKWIRECGAGQIVVKKRGSPIDVDVLRRQLDTVKGGATYTVFLTRVCDKPWMMLAQKTRQT